VATARGVVINIRDQIKAVRCELAMRHAVPEAGRRRAVDAGRMSNSARLMRWQQFRAPLLDLLAEPEWLAHADPCQWIIGGGPDVSEMNGTVIFMIAIKA
jgi:hypothetical protein